MIKMMMKQAGQIIEIRLKMKDDGIYNKKHLK